MRKLTAIAIALGLTCAGVWLPCARAATIDTYDFTQGGYTFNGSPFLTGVLTGSFTGDVDRQFHRRCRIEWFHRDR